MLASHSVGDVGTSLHTSGASLPVVGAYITQLWAIGGQEQAKLADIRAFVGGHSAILTQECATGAATRAIVGERYATVAEPCVFVGQPLANLVKRCAKHVPESKREQEGARLQNASQVKDGEVR